MIYEKLKQTTGDEDVQNIIVAADKIAVCSVLYFNILDFMQPWIRPICLTRYFVVVKMA